LIAALIVRASLTRITIYDYERGVKYVKGKLSGVLDPGRHWLLKGNSTVHKVDIRPMVLAIPGQEVLSSDGVGLKVSLTITYEVADPAKAINTIQSYVASMYSTLQVSLREIIGASKIDDVLERRNELGKQVSELGGAALEDFGLRLLTCDIKDIMFPGQLKKMFAQVVQAQKEGQAALERARGETAALRNLANAARMVEDSPALLQLRLLQELGAQGGNTVVVGFPQSSTPLPITRRDQLSQPEAPLTPDPTDEDLA
jgi:regulator of protease activity HflC (stomatin/prohibitin superfamily)